MKIDGSAVIALVSCRWSAPACCAGYYNGDGGPGEVHYP